MCFFEKYMILNFCDDHVDTQTMTETVTKTFENKKEKHRLSELFIWKILFIFHIFCLKSLNLK